MGVAVLAGAGLVVSGGADPAVDRVEGWFEELTGTGPDPRTEPAEVEPPGGLVLPDLVPPLPPAEALEARPVSPTQVRRALEGPLSRPVLGRRVSVAVAGLTGEAAYEKGGAAVPASTTKVVTAFASLRTIDARTTFATRAVLDGGRVVLVGGGDPQLAREPAGEGADLGTLARRTARALRERGIRQVRLGYDDTLFSGPAWNPSWPDTYRDVVAPITALMVDDGRPATGFGRVGDPSYAAAEEYAAALRSRGIRVRGNPSAATAPAASEPADVELLAEVESEPVGALVDRLLQASDNEVAEVLLRHVGLAAGERGSTTGGLAALSDVLGELEVPEPRRLRDGSGLSRENLFGPDTLLAILQAVAASDAADPVRGLFPGLPVAGFSGSLAFRFDDVPGAAVGRVRAKTGTLRGVRSLAGIAVGRDGTPMVFALMADRIPEDEDEVAEGFLDRAAAALAACRCGRAG